MGIINEVITLVMAFAPIIGSYVNLFFNWRGNFVVLLLIGVICLISSFLFIPKGRTKPEIKISIKEYLPVIKSTKVIYYIITISLMTQAY